jgi:hypothetical protein
MNLTNGNKLPLVIIMDCLNGYFVAPAIDCLGESLMKAPNGGAIASFASSGLTVPEGQHEMGQRLFQSLHGGQSIALGDATRLAKAATTDIDCPPHVDPLRRSHDEDQVSKKRVEVSTTCVSGWAHQSADALSV